jgi:hypothetical protein
MLPEDSNYTCQEGADRDVRRPQYPESLAYLRKRPNPVQWPDRRPPANLCDNIKATGIVIYTMHVNTDNDPTSAVLQYCASGSDKFSTVTSATQIMAAFNNIGNSLSKLRVAR